MWRMVKQSSAIWCHFFLIFSHHIVACILWYCAALFMPIYYLPPSKNNLPMRQFVKRLEPAFLLAGLIWNFYFHSLDAWTNCCTRESNENLVSLLYASIIKLALFFFLSSALHFTRRSRWRRVNGKQLALRRTGTSILILILLLGSLLLPRRSG